MMHYLLRHGDSTCWLWLKPKWGVAPRTWAAGSDYFFLMEESPPRTCGAGPWKSFCGCPVPPLLLWAMAGEASSLAEVEKEKLRTWCQSTGVENASDLAFYFTSFDQALEQAGRVVASAWLDARADTSRGLPVLVRSLFHGEAVPQGRPTPSSATPSRASTAAAAAPAEVPQPSRAASRVSPERAAAVGHTHQLLAVLLGFAPAAPMMSTAARAYLALLAETVCKQFDSATIQRVITTCREVQTAVAAAGLPGPDAHFFASFVRTHSSPRRVFDDLCWSVRHLQFSWDLQLVDPPSPSSSCHGTKRLKTQPALPESRVTTPEPVTRIWHAWASGTLPREPSILQRVQMGVFLGFFRNQERPAWSAHHWMRGTGAKTSAGWVWCEQCGKRRGWSPESQAAWAPVSTQWSR